MQKNIKPCSVTSKWQRPDLADSGSTLAALPLDELQASAFQNSPQARIPVSDPMVLDVNGNPNIQKTNAYRLGVNQFRVQRANEASPFLYCLNMYKATPRIFADSIFTKQAASPTPDAANLFGFLVQRFNAAVQILGCPTLLGYPSPLDAITAPATREHIAKYSREEIARFKSLTTIVADATLSQSTVDQVSALQAPDGAEDVFAVGESTIATTAAAPTSYVIPLIVVSSILGGIAATVTTVVVVKKVRQHRGKRLSVSATSQGSQQLGYSTDISNGYPVPVSPKGRPVSPSHSQKV